MRAMAFSATIEQLLGQMKTCTRREASGTAAALRPGQMIRAVDQLMGLSKGRNARTLAVLRVVDVRPAPPLTAAEVAAEGFPGKGPEFLEAVLRRMYGEVPLVRVGFAYVAVAAPNLVELTTSRAILDRLREVGNRASSQLASLRRGEGTCGDLKALRDLAAREALLSPDDHRQTCADLDVKPAQLWRAPRKRRAERAAVDDGQRDLFG